MSFKRKIALAASTAALLGMAGAAQAALFDRGNGMIYDDTLNITWLADWNYAKTSGFDADGRIASWATANTWANNLVYGGFDDWRLPTALNPDGSGPCAGYSCRRSEMGHMFFKNWEASAFNSFNSGTNAANLALFTNVQSFDYWSGTEQTPGTGAAWGFSTSDGGQFYSDDTNAWYAVAVRPGDVVAAVPEPQTYALMLMGLGAVLLARKKRTR